MKKTLGLVVAGSILLMPCLAANPTLAEALQGAKAGDKGSQYIAGMMYIFAQNTQQNLPEGVRWLQASARSGLPQAMVALALLYDVGQGVPLDQADASRLRKQAADLGDATARGQLDDDRKLPGQADFRRASVLTDLKKLDLALPYATRAVAAGSRNAKLLLGRAYHYGFGTSIDLREAVRWYRASSDAGLAEGARHVAYMYEFGLGVGVSRPTALQFYDRAAAGGSDLAKRAAANLRSPDYDVRVNFSLGGDAIGPTCNIGYQYVMGTCYSYSNEKPNYEHGKSH